MAKTIITNKFGLPETFVRAASVDRHITAGDISVTTLIDAPQIRILKKTNILEEDVMDRIWMMMGTAVHKVLELGELQSHEARIVSQAAEVLKFKGAKKASEFLENFIKEHYPEVSDDVLLEQTMQLEMDGMLISGTADRIVKSEFLIEDYKNTSVWSYIFPESRKKWAEQLNIYAYMADKIGIPITNLRVIAIFKDWRESDKLKNKDYPAQKVMYIPIKRLDNDKIEAYIKTRVRLHQMAENGIMECTPKDRWSSPDTYAVLKKNGTRAVSKFTTEDEARMYVKLNNHRYTSKESLYVQVRKGGAKRCEGGYCPVAKFCSQFQKEVLENQDEKLVN